MKIINIQTAFDKCFENPNLSKIKNLILDYPDKYWMSGSGVSIFEYFEPNGKKSKITLCGSKGFGFLLLYEMDSPEKGRFYLTEGNHTGEKAYSASGGNIFPCFREYLVSKETTWKAIEHFLESGEILDNLSWTSEYKVPDDF